MRRCQPGKLNLKPTNFSYPKRRRRVTPKQTIIFFLKIRTSLTALERTAQDTPATADSAPPAAAKFKFQSQQLEDDPKRKKVQL
jgi:hypothetical protein